MQTLLAFDRWRLMVSSLLGFPMPVVRQRADRKHLCADPTDDLADTQPAAPSPKAAARTSTRKPSTRAAR